MLALCLLATSSVVQGQVQLWLNPDDIYSFTYDQLFTVDSKVGDDFTITTGTAGFHVNYYKELFFGDLVQTPAPPKQLASLTQAPKTGPLSCNRVKWLSDTTAAAYCKPSIRVLTMDTSKKSITYSSFQFPLVPKDSLNKYLRDYQAVIFVGPQRYYKVVATKTAASVTNDEVTIFAGTVNKGRQTSLTLNATKLLGKTFTG